MSDEWFGSGTDKPRLDVTGLKQYIKDVDLEMLWYDNWYDGPQSGVVETPDGYMYYEWWDENDTLRLMGLTPITVEQYDFLKLFEETEVDYTATINGWEVMAQNWREFLKAIGADKPTAYFYD